MIEPMFWDKSLKIKSDQSEKINGTFVKNHIEIYTGLSKLLFSKQSILTKKEKIDIQRITRSTDYASLRSYMMKLVSEFYRQASNTNEDRNVIVLCQMAKFIATIIDDFDRFRDEQSEAEEEQEPYAV